MTEQQLADLERFNWDAFSGYESDAWISQMKKKVNNLIAAVRERDAEIARLREHQRELLSPEEIGHFREQARLRDPLAATASLLSRRDDKAEAARG